MSESITYTTFFIPDAGAPRRLLDGAPDLARLARGGLSGHVIRSDTRDASRALHHVGAVGRSSVSAAQAAERLRKHFSQREVRKRLQGQRGNMLLRSISGGNGGAG